MEEYLRGQRLSLLAADALPPFGGLESLLTQEQRECIRTVTSRIGQNCIFVELEARVRQPGISGGAIVANGAVRGMVIECWNSFDRPVVIGVPVSKPWAEAAVRAVLESISSVSEKGKG